MKQMVSLRSVLVLILHFPSPRLKLCDKSCCPSLILCTEISVVRRSLRDSWFDSHLKLNISFEGEPLADCNSRLWSYEVSSHRKEGPGY